MYGQTDVQRKMTKVPVVHFVLQVQSANKQELSSSKILGKLIKVRMKQNIRNQGTVNR